MSYFREKGKIINIRSVRRNEDFMDSRNLDRALDIVSRLIMGENVSEKGADAALYQEYSTNAEVYDIVQMSLKKMNLNLYEYKNALYVSAGQNNTVFGYTNEELKKELGIKLNKELYLAYFVVYNTITNFYTDTAATTYAEYVRIEDVVENVDKAINGIIDKSAGIVLDEVEENSFKQIAMSWEELPAATVEEQSGVRAARNSKAGFVKMVFNFLISQELLVENQTPYPGERTQFDKNAAALSESSAQGARYYPTDRFRALIENYFDDYRGRFSQLLMSDKQKNSAAVVGADFQGEREE